MAKLTPVQVPADICWWFHPDLAQHEPDLGDEERGYTTEEWCSIQDKAGVDIYVEVRGNSEIEDAIGREIEGAEWTGWNPLPPSPEHFLIGAFDTEDGDAVLWWAKPRKTDRNTYKITYSLNEKQCTTTAVAFQIAEALSNFETIAPTAEVLAIGMVEIENA